MPIFRLSEKEIWFPKSELAEEDGLLAVGGDLSAKRLLLAYANGIFPWYNKEEPLLWWCPHERFVIFPEKIHISQSMRKQFKNGQLEVRINNDFKDVIHRCRMMREWEEGSWITDEMEAAYIRLHELGYALCVECFMEGELAGGLYGVQIGRCFFGESMFSIKANGSKVALIALARLLEQQKFVFIDCQFYTEHLESMGGVYLPWKDYKQLLEKGISGR